jgi:hypothetical protein
VRNLEITFSFIFYASLNFKFAYWSNTATKLLLLLVVVEAVAVLSLMIPSAIKMRTSNQII